MSIFEQASRVKLRFETNKGLLSVEDIWDLPLTSTRGPSLDSIAIDLDSQLKATGENVSFVFKERKADETIKLRFDIVLHVIEVRKAENDAATTLKENKEKKQRIMALIAQKQDEKLSSASLEELTALAASLPG